LAPLRSTAKHGGHPIEERLIVNGRRVDRVEFRMSNRWPVCPGKAAEVMENGCGNDPWSTVWEAPHWPKAVIVR